MKNMDAARLRVPMGFILSLLVIFFLRPSSAMLFSIGISISLIGLLIRMWAAGCINKAKILATTGPYALVRHPLYLGSALLAIGFSLSVTNYNKLLPTLFIWGIVTSYFSFIYSSTIKKEERHLAENFGPDWITYKEKTPAFIPYRLKSIKNMSLCTYSVARYIKNKEYNAAVGWLAVTLLFFFLL
jgi:protein-S-isoprenylcysteine O-methyltransferase Ste14